MARGAHRPATSSAAVLLLLAVTFIVMAAGPPDAWVRVLTVLLQGLTLLAALLGVAGEPPPLPDRERSSPSSSLARRDRLRRAELVEGPDGVFFLLNILLVATTPVVIARALWRRQVIDVRTVLGAVCIYVLLGMMFAFVYAAINGIGETPFFVQTAHATTPDFLYFSFITQTTVGYGDFTAAGDLGRALAVVEALTGQLYLVTIIAVLVSRLSAARADARSPADVATTDGRRHARSS